MIIDDVDNANDLVDRERDCVIADHQARREQEEKARRIAESFKPAPPLDEPQDCVECGDPVPIERLRRLPRTRRCDACGAEAELRYRGAPYA